MDMSVTARLPLAATSAPASAASLPARQVKQDEPAVESVTPERAELEQAVKDLQAHVNTAQRNLEFSIDDSTHAVVVKVIATDSGEIIRQLPTEAALKLAQSLAEGRSGLLDATI
ncbi:flagellar protein FlaG [Pseudomonas sp. CFBP 8758]|uniref:flagellar protein FlaG n=1 Tax=Pseudomonas sp. CFBP 8758 TaxID=2775286 RepID=UPI00177D155A|nr:flagellar protein FlaG [Pseudomonas sp. CFBP 8758]MBD8592435.1 flagellar protein FlaG [Pseudomonas sp. CFBP 8758]